MMCEYVSRLIVRLLALCILSTSVIGRNYYVKSGERVELKCSMHYVSDISTLVWKAESLRENNTETYDVAGATNIRSSYPYPSYTVESFFGYNQWKDRAVLGSRHGDLIIEGVTINDTWYTYYCIYTGIESLGPLTNVGGPHHNLTIDTGRNSFHDIKSDIFLLRH